MSERSKDVRRQYFIPLTDAVKATPWQPYYTSRLGDIRWFSFFLGILEHENQFPFFGKCLTLSLKVRFLPFLYFSRHFYTKNIPKYIKRKNAQRADEQHTKICKKYKIPGRGFPHRHETFLRGAIRLDRWKCLGRQPWLIDGLTLDRLLASL